MVVRIRLARWGRRHLPFFRIVVADGRSPRDGRHLDVVGTYNAAGHSAAEVAARVKRVELDVGRIKYWLSVGAQPSDTGTCGCTAVPPWGGGWGPSQGCRSVGAAFQCPRCRGKLTYFCSRCPLSPPSLLLPFATVPHPVFVFLAAFPSSNVSCCT